MEGPPSPGSVRARKAPSHPAYSWVSQHSRNTRGLQPSLTATVSLCAMSNVFISTPRAAALWVRRHRKVIPVFVGLCEEQAFTPRHPQPALRCSLSSLLSLQHHKVKSVKENNLILPIYEINFNRFFFEVCFCLVRTQQESTYPLSGRWRTFGLSERWSGVVSARRSVHIIVPLLCFLEQSFFLKKKKKYFI